MSSRPPIDLDALLGRWPEPSRASTSEAQAWDELADATVARARAAAAPAASAQEMQLDSLLAAPTLEAEPGEPTTAGVSKMSESDDDKPRPSLRRPSLKELAERVSKTPPPPSSLPPGSLPPSSLAAPPPPSSLSAVASKPPSAPPASMPGPASATPASLSALARASQPVITTRDSAPPASGAAGISPAAASSPPAAASSPPSSASTASEPPPSAAPASNVVQLSEAKPAPKSGGSSFRAIGVAIFGLGAAAAAAMFFMGKGTEQPPEAPKADVVETAEPKAEEPKPAEPEAVAKKDEAAGDGTLDIANLDDAVAKVEPGAAEEALAPPASAPPGWTPPPKPTGTARVEPEGDLASAMKDAVGAETAKPVEATPATEPTPAGALPDRPPVGSVTSAINGAMGAAKACVAGADDVSRATVTFNSSGSVQSVSVGGWAADKGGAASCIKAAFQSAKVSPFSKPTFTTGATIRP